MLFGCAGSSTSTLLCCGASWSGDKCLGDSICNGDTDAPYSYVTTVSEN
ncbi:hypothetical protein [Anaplasma phagocytophilum]|nr:hypothetical protein [Anaplasma phagocytophilum]